MASDTLIDSETMDAIDAARALIAGGTRMIGFTGAGISTESGVPDFRSPGSPWLANKPIPFDVFLASEAARIEAWRRKFIMDDLYAHAQPSRGHRAMASLVARGRMTRIVTQNIDGLHQASGVDADRIVELHGNGTYAACLSCRLRHELSDIRRVFEQSGRAPICEGCGGIVKSATISFGQAMPAEAVARAEAATRDCDVFVVAGSSLVVYPAAALPLLARRNGARLVIINRDETELDDAADVVAHADIGTVLAPFIAAA